MWIELTTTENEKFAVNLDHVVRMVPMAQGTQIVPADGAPFYVNEELHMIIGRVRTIENFRRGG